MPPSRWQLTIYRWTERGESSVLSVDWTILHDYGKWKAAHAHDFKNRLTAGLV